MVVWADAHAGDRQWWEPEELPEEGEYLVQSVGFLLPLGAGGKAQHITLAQSLTSEGMVDHIIYIPSGMVRRICVLSQENPNN